MSNELVKKDEPVGTITRLQQFLDTPYMQNALRDLLGDAQMINRLKRVALMCISKNPKLRQCSLASVAGAVAESVRLGLEINDYRGSAHIVPYETKHGMEAVFQVGYQGLITLAYRTGVIQYIHADVVFTNDEWSVELGSNPKIVHKPNLISERGERLFAYGVAYMKESNVPIVCVVDKPNIERHRECSKKKNSELWTLHWIWGWRKTAIRELVKFLPASANEFVEVVQRDAAAEAGEFTGEDVIVDAIGEVVQVGDTEEHVEEPKQ